MANYPSTNQDKSTSVTPRSGVLIDVSTSGTIRGVDLYTEEVVDIVVVHDLISTSEKEALIDFYKTYKTAEFTFTYPGDNVDYLCLFKNKPKTEWLAPSLWKVTSNLIGIADPNGTGGGT